jgi:hypothetical protein
MITITGNTYPVKEKLKELGGRWNSKAQGWDVPDDKADAARSIVAAAPPSNHTPRTGGRRWGRRYGGTNPYAGYTRFSGGGESYRNLKGRCEDAPCCGCCS